MRRLLILLPALLLWTGPAHARGERATDLARHVGRDAILYMETPDVGKLRWHTLGSRLEKAWRTPGGQELLRAMSLGMAQPFVDLMRKGGPGPLAKWSEVLEGPAALAIHPRASGHVLWELIAKPKGDTGAFIAALAEVHVKVEKLPAGQLLRITPKAQRLAPTQGGLAAVAVFQRDRRPPTVGGLLIWVDPERFSAQHGRVKLRKWWELSGLLPSPSAAIDVNTTNGGGSEMNLRWQLPKLRSGLVDALAARRRGCASDFPDSLPKKPDFATHVCADPVRLYETFLEGLKRESVAGWMAFVSQVGGIEAQAKVKLREDLLPAIAGTTHVFHVGATPQQALIFQLKDRGPFEKLFEKLAALEGVVGQKPADGTPWKLCLAAQKDTPQVGCAALGARFLALSATGEGLEALVSDRVGIRRPMPLDGMPGGGQIQFAADLPPSRIGAEVTVDDRSLGVRAILP